jgi:hypothetical protein
VWKFAPYPSNFDGEGMRTSFLSSRARSLNARVGAIALALAAFATLLLSHTDASLAPLRILTLAGAAFAVWAFCDEMGIGKPLNRAGFVCFALAAVAKVQILLGVTAPFAGRYQLLYAAFLLLAVLFWSVAFLHRQRELKVAGAVGLIATLAPLVFIIAGHVAVGVGAVVGVGSLLSAAESGASSDLAFVTMVERIFGLWGYVAGWLLWRGHIGGQTAVR